MAYNFVENLFIFIVMLIGCGVIFYQIYLGKERIKALKVVASELGFTFENYIKIDFREKLEHFYLFSFRGSKCKKGVMWASRNGHFDTIFTQAHIPTSYDPNARFRMQTVFCIEFHSKRLPVFELRPKKIKHKKDERYSAQDITFDSQPTFSDEYLLRGSDKYQIKQLFTDELISFIEERGYQSIESSGNIVILYRISDTYEPEHIVRFRDRCEKFIDIDI